MPDRDLINLEDLLKDPDVQKATSNENQELIERRDYTPPTCSVFNSDFIKLEKYDGFNFMIDDDAKEKLPNIIDKNVMRLAADDSPDDDFKEKITQKRNIGIVFSGGPAPGGHNVIAGLFDAAKKANPESKIFGFLMGPDGIIENETMELTQEIVDKHRNLGGFSMIKTGRTKIDTKKKNVLSRETARNLELDAIVVVGGDDSNTNAAFLAQELFQDDVQMIGVPKTIDGDIQVKDSDGKVLCAMSFGFHTAARAFAKSISNLCTDCSSDVKYWHVCKVMGRSASHLALEVALQTHANMTLIGEDLADYIDNRRLEHAEKTNTVDYTAYGMTLRHLSRMICDGIVRRAAVGKNYGVLVIPEGVLECINEIQHFIIKLNAIIGEYNYSHDTGFHMAFPTTDDKLEYLRRLAVLSREDGVATLWGTRDDDLFNTLPVFFREGLLTERDSHGNFQFSLVKTDKVIMELVQDYLEILRERGTYKIGIHRSYYEKTLMNAGLQPDIYGPLLFKNYNDADYLLVKKTIMSNRTLKNALVKAGLIDMDEHVPQAVTKIYKKSVPNFKTQSHFYGYDGRGSDPTRFDCNYTYNLGLTVFSLIANGETGLMAAIKNLEGNFEKWEPVGLPIAPLMKLEERKGKLALVIEKSLVDINGPAFRVVKAFREKWLAATPGPDNYRRPGPIRFTGLSEEDRPLTLELNALTKSK